MTDRTPDDIEREIEAERGALARSIDALQNQFSPEMMIDTASGYLREHGGIWAETATRQARDNPVALGVTAVGLAWLIAGPARKRSKAGTYDRWAFTHDEESFAENYGETRHDETRMGTKTPRRAVAPMSTPSRAATPRVGYDHREYTPVGGFRSTGDPMAGSMRGFDDRLAHASGDVHEPGLRERLTDATEEARAWLHHAFASVRDRFGSDAPTWTRSPDWTSTDDRSQDGEGFRKRLMEGTEKMTDAARDRVIAAREAALDAQHYITARSRDYAESGREAYSEQPLIGGLIAFGIGAIIGAALPRTRREDQYIGAYRDQAMEEAERIYHQESGKLRAVADAALGEAKNMASETMDNIRSGTPSAHDAAAKAEGTAKNASDRVVKAARDEAKKQDLGGSVS